MPDQALNFDSKDEKSKRASLNVPLAGTLGVGGLTTSPGSTGKTTKKGDDIEIDLKLKAPGGIGAPETETTTSAEQSEMPAPETTPEATGAEGGKESPSGPESSEQKPKSESTGKAKKEKPPTEEAAPEPEEEKPEGTEAPETTKQPGLTAPGTAPEAGQNVPEEAGAEAAPEEAGEEGGEQPPTKQPPTGEKPAEKPPVSAPAKAPEAQTPAEQPTGEKKPEAEKSAENHQEAGEPGADTTPKKAEPPTEQAAGGTPPSATEQPPKQAGPAGPVPPPPHPPPAQAGEQPANDNASGAQVPANDNAQPPTPGTAVAPAGQQPPLAPQPPTGAQPTEANAPQLPAAGPNAGPDFNKQTALDRAKQNGGATGVHPGGAGGQHAPPTALNKNPLPQVPPSGAPANDNAEPPAAGNPSLRQRIAASMQSQRAKLKKQRQQLQRILDKLENKVPQARISKLLQVLKLFMPGVCAKVTDAVNGGKNIKGQTKIAVLTARVTALKTARAALKVAKLGANAIDAGRTTLSVVLKLWWTIIVPLLSPIVFLNLFLIRWLTDTGALTSVVVKLIKELNIILKPLEEELANERKKVGVRKQIANINEALYNGGQAPEAANDNAKKPAGDKKKGGAENKAEESPSAPSATAPTSQKKAA